MSAYHFTTRWIIPATCVEVYRTLEAVEDLSRWWPSVYLDVKQLEKGQPGGVGKRVMLYTKGFLPYTLKWQFVVTNTEFPYGIFAGGHRRFCRHGRMDLPPARRRPMRGDLRLAH
jgi:hypothetical protein